MTVTSGEVKSKTVSLVLLSNKVGCSTVTLRLTVLRAGFDRLRIKVLVPVLTLLRRLFDHLFHDLLHIVDVVSPWESGKAVVC